MDNVFTKSESFKSEYSSAIVRVGELTPIEGSDFLAKTLVFGTQIVVRKDQVKEGDIMVYSANETQLNERFLSVNNLYDISCRDKNANHEEVDEFYKPYIPIKEKADELRRRAKNMKDAMDKLTYKASKCKKLAKKKTKDLESLNPESEEYNNKQQEIEGLMKDADKYTAKALGFTTQYTNLKNEIAEVVKSGSDIITEVKKHCGYMNKYGRVRCLTLRGVPSFGVLFSPEDLFKFDSSITMEDIEAYVGNEFDTVNGELFVKAYVPPMPPERVVGNKNKAQNRLKGFDRMIDGEFFFHYDTTQLQKVIDFFKPEDIVDISKKIHGTSIIIGKLHVKKQIKLPFMKALYNKFVDLTHMTLFGKRFIDYEVVYGPIFSSRKVIKNRYINENVSSGYYSTDVWNEYGQIIYPYLDEGMTVYGEICGYETGLPKYIQKMYDYGCAEGENFIMFYRISTTNEDGTKKEWEVPEVLEWTRELIHRMKEDGDENYKRIHPIDLFYHGTLEDLYPDLDTENHWHEELLERLKLEKKFDMEENEPLCKNEVPAEGIVIRKCADTALRASKLKSNAFFLAESIRMDEGDLDCELREGYDINEKTFDL